MHGNVTRQSVHPIHGGIRSMIILVELLRRFRAVEEEIFLRLKEKLRHLHLRASCDSIPLRKLMGTRA
jgi:hypothetical protein